jgi:molecular chaperone GrpE
VLSAVLRRGYRIGDRVLRPAMVTVADRADDGTAEPAADAPAPAEAQPTDEQA